MPLLPPALIAALPGALFNKDMSQRTKIDAVRFCRAQQSRRLSGEILASWICSRLWSIPLVVSGMLLLLVVIAAKPPVAAVGAPAAARSLDLVRSASHPASVQQPYSAETVLPLHPGDDLGSVLRRAGVVPTDADRAAALIDAAIFPDRIAGGIDMRLTKGTVAGTAQPLERLSLRPRMDLLLTVARGPAGLVLVARPVAIDASPLEVRGVVGRDLTGSMLAACVPPTRIALVEDALRDRAGSAAMLHPSDRFELVFEQQRAADGSVVTGNLLYAALMRGHRSIVEKVRSPGDVALREVGASTGSGRNGSGEDRPAGALPIDGRLTSGYGMRMHPIIGYTRLHAGIDVAAPWGAPVLAPARGIVSVAGWQGGHGNYVRLENGPGLASGYAHLSRIAVIAGQSVRSGQIIGYVGSTGLSTGPHLHYEVFRDGRAVDPLRNGIFAAPGDSTSPSAFADAVRSLRALVRPSS